MAYLIDTKVLAENIKHYRRLQNYTTRQLADRALLALHVIEEMESGGMTPSMAQIGKVADVLEVRSHHLVMPAPPAREYYESC